MQDGPMLGSITVFAAQCHVPVGKEREGGKEGDGERGGGGGGRKQDKPRGTMQFVISLFIG